MKNSNNLLKLPQTPLNIVLLVNGKVGFEISKFLLEKKEKISAIFIHEEENRQYGDEISGLFNKKKVFTSDLFKDQRAKKIISDIEPDILITCYWNHILKKEIFEIPKYGAINLHPSYLPVNRGWYPNVWPFIDGSQAGVTLHKIDEGADTGPIIAQEKTVINSTDTAGSIFDKQQNQITKLFKKTWTTLKEKGIKLRTQDNKKSTYHTRNEVAEKNRIYLDKKYKARDLIDLIRSRSFRNKGLVYFIENGEKVNLKIELQKESND